MAECSAETLHHRDHAFEVGGVLGVRAALSADSRVRPQIVTHGLEQGPPRAAERIAVSHRRPDGVENPRLALSRHLREDLHQRDGVIVTLDVPPDAYRGAGDVP